MSTTTLPGLSCTATVARRAAVPTRVAPTAARPDLSAAPAVPVAAAGWLDRLAAWADAGPQHHRLGRWTRYTR